MAEIDSPKNRDRISEQLDQEPDVFDVIVFKAFGSNPELQEGEIEYADPIASRAKLLPSNWQNVALNDGTAAHYYGKPGEPLQMLIKEQDIPKRSVIQYDEYINDTDIQTVTLYVLFREELGRPPSITNLYHLIPFINDEGNFIETPLTWINPID